MKPFDLYNLLRSVTKESYNQRKLPFYLMRSKKALDNLHKRGWDDEQITVLAYNTYQVIVGRGLPATVPYMLGILCNTTQTPGVTSTEDSCVGYDAWIEQEKKRLGNAE